MLHEIKKYPVQHPLLRKYIKFFWELRVDYLQLNHALIPQRNINLKFNLGETPQYLFKNGKDYLLGEVFFSGLQDHFLNSCMKLNGKVDILGICFLPDGFFPFFKIPLAEFKNGLWGADEIGIKRLSEINEQLKEAKDVECRLSILENALLSFLYSNSLANDNFREIFNALNQYDQLPIADFCLKNNLSMRKLERMYNKYIGVSALTYNVLNRFQNSLNQLLSNQYSILTDLAYDNGYFDQMHFIKDFKRFTGNTPRKFVHKNNSILQIGKLT